MAIHADHTINLVFATPIMTAKLDREFTSEEKAKIKQCKKHTLPSEGNRISKDRHILNSPELSDLKAEITTLINQYTQEIHNPKDHVEVYITQSWVNYTDPGEFHHKHEHPNSFLSGVVYIDVEEGKDTITFHKAGYSQIAIEPKEFNYLNSSSWWFSVTPKDIYVFPSSLTHSVELTKSNKTRVSIAFNTFLRGSIGNFDDLTGLNL